jgi:rod shape determining protein RodA
VGEQLGFAGAATVLALLAIVSWRVLHAAQVARDPFGRLLATGAFALIAFSVFENAGMAMGIMPIAGIPLPFLSYGGSATVAFFAAVGIALSVQLRRQR